MDDLININYDSEQPTVLGRELHKALEVKTAYKDWFPRMCEYGFTEGLDFCSFLSKSTGGRPSTDHQLTIPMAKEICMLQRSEKGKMFRQYFIKIEEAWNTPETIMARALKLANHRLDELKNTNIMLEAQLKDKQLIVDNLTVTNKALSGDISTWDYKSVINALVRKYANVSCGNNFALAWNTYYKNLKYKQHINLKQRLEASDNSKAKMIDFLKENEVKTAIKITAAMCEECGIKVGMVINEANIATYIS